MVRLLSKVDHYFLFLPEMHDGCNFSAFLLILLTISLVVVFITIAILVHVNLYHKGVLSCISLITNRAEYLSCVYWPFV